MAVAKDRAIEALMQVGDRFVLNVLAEENHQPLLRHFLKRFRLEPIASLVATLEGTAAGGPVLSEALAYLDCHAAAHGMRRPLVDLCGRQWRQCG